MEGEETIDIPYSEESFEEEEAPSEEYVEEVEEEVVEEAEPEVQLFELPDGRKVDAETLQSEWKNNFYPEYTRKSQELAALKNQPKEETPKVYEDPEYVPQTYAEIIQLAKEAALNEIRQTEEQRIAQQQAVENAVIEQLNEVKAIDPKVDENRLFLHANKYGFRDLKVAYENMKDMSLLAKNVQQTTAQNIAKRNDPVSVSPGAIGHKPDPSQFSTALDYLRSLN